MVASFDPAFHGMSKSDVPIYRNINCVDSNTYHRICMAIDLFVFINVYRDPLEI